MLRELKKISLGMLLLSLIAIGLSAALATAEGGEQDWRFSVEGMT